VADSLSLETSPGHVLEDFRDGGESGRPRLDSYYSAASRHSAYFSTAGSEYRSVADNTSYVAVQGGEDKQPRRSKSNVRMYGPPSQLPALTQPVPDHWSSIEGTIEHSVTFTVAYILVQFTLLGSSKVILFSTSYIFCCHLMFYDVFYDTVINLDYVLFSGKMISV
jgi:hypothetical protein